MNAQEIRHCLTSDRCRNFLKQCAGSEIFLDTVGETFRDHVRMVDRELVLRFCAFQLLGSESYRGAMDPYLDEAAAWIDDPERTTPEDLDRLAAEFGASMRRARAVFGQRAFRKWPIGRERLFPLNRALFESWAVAFAESVRAEIPIDSARIVDGARTLMTHDQEYVDAISTSTGGTSKVMYRLAKAQELVMGR